MEAKELRIGNYVHVLIEGETEKDDVLIECKIDLTDPLGLTEYDLWCSTINSRINEELEYYDDIKPIPLTEEWLLKFGFEKRFLDQEGYVTGWFLWDNLIVVWDDGFTCAISGINIIHVHQFQNLYFALRGEELTLKEKG